MIHQQNARTSANGFNTDLTPNQQAKKNTCPIYIYHKIYYNLVSPVFSGVAFFDFLVETGVFEADSLGLFFPWSTFKQKDDYHKSP
jgi:hypothetical protein